jgi:hypothetical protein
LFKTHEFADDVYPAFMRRAAGDDLKGPGLAPAVLSPPAR